MKYSPKLQWTPLLAHVRCTGPHYSPHEMYYIYMSCIGPYYSPREMYYIA